MVGAEVGDPVAAAYGPGRAGRGRGGWCARTARARERRVAVDEGGAVRGLAGTARAGQEPSPSLRIVAAPYGFVSPEQAGRRSLRIFGLTSSLTGSRAKSASQRSGVRDGEVRAEEDLVLQQGVRVVHELRREVLRRPAGQVDVHARLVRGHGERLVPPGEGRMRQDDPQVREVGGHVVHMEGVGVLQPDPAPAGHPGADAGLARVEEGVMVPVSSITRSQAGTPRTGRRGKKPWMLGELEPPPRTPRPAAGPARSPAFPRKGPIEAKGTQDVCVGGGRPGDLLRWGPARCRWRTRRPPRRSRRPSSARGISLAVSPKGRVSYSPRTLK